MKGLTKKAVLRIGGVCLLIFGLCIVVSIFSTRSSMSTQVNENIEKNVMATALEANEFFAHYDAAGQTLANNNLVQTTLNYGMAVPEPFVDLSAGHTVASMVEDIAANDSTVMAAYVACGQKNDTIMSGGLWQSVDFPTLTISERGWYVDAVANNGLAVCDPYIDEISGDLVTTISVPINSNGKTIGVVGFDLSLNSVNEILQKCQIGEDSQVLTVLPSGEIFYSSMADEAGEYLPIADISAELASYMVDENASGIIEFSYNGTSYIGSKASIGNTGWVVLSSISKTEAYKAVTKSNLLLGGMLVLAWIITMILVVASFQKLAIKPVKRLQDVADLMAEGRVDLEIAEIPNADDEIQFLNNSLRNVLENSKTQATTLEGIAAGKSESNINVRSDKDAVNVSLQGVVNTLNDLAGEIISLGNNFKAGNTSHRADANKFQGDFKGLIDSINEMVDSIMDPLSNIAASIGSLGLGELVTIENNAQGDFAEILDNIQTSIDNVRELVSDTESLAKAAISGDLDKRADASKHNGDFRTVIEGINKTLDMVVDKTNWYENIINSVDTPIVVSGMDGNAQLFNNAFNGSSLKSAHSDVVGLFKNGTTSSQIESGDQIYIQNTVEIKDRAGMPIGYVTAMQDVTSIQKPAEYSAKEIARLQSNLDNMANGNFTFDNERPEVDEYTAAVAEQYGMIDASINQVAKAVAALVNDSREMANAAASGQLSFRLDANAHHGDYSEVIQGLNNTVDVLLRPIEEAVMVLAEIARGNLNVNMTGIYQGDHNQIKDSLNQTVGNLRNTVAEIDRVLKELADCNLTVKADDGAFIGDFATIKESLASIISSLGAVMTEINQAAAQVAGGSKQLSSAAQVLADGSTQQASSIQQITAAMGSIAEMTKNNAEDAKKASKMSTDVMTNASAGNAKMKDMLASMNEINEASASISKVIKVIDDIAFQTNILALNAAVEAARAGVHGKGFAVVADEVRNLAAKSASAVQDTTALIEGSIAKASQGTVIANEAASAFEEIVNGITETSNLCDAIAEVSVTQEENVAEVNEAIGTVSVVVQSNSATAEESAAQSEELYAQANLLNTLVDKFQLEGGKRTSSPAKSLGSEIPAISLSEPAIGEITLDLDGCDKY